MRNLVFVERQVQLCVFTFVCQNRRNVRLSVGCGGLGDRHYSLILRFASTEHGKLQHLRSTCIDQYSS
jgi:hypothetical protein